MKRILLILMTLMLSMVSYGNMPKEVSTSDKRLKYEKEMITYNGVPYTGKILANDKSSKDVYEGFITLKNGHLNDMTEVGSTTGDRFKFTVKNGKFNGEMIVRSIVGKMDGAITFENGIIKKMKMKMPEMEMDLTANKSNKFNGIMSLNGESLKFQNGAADYMGAKISFSVNPKTGDFEMEVTANGRTQKQTIPSNMPTIKQFEEIIFPGLLN